MDTLVVIGATGGTGRELLRAAPGAGYAVTAVVRDPARLAPEVPPHRVVTADIRSAADLRPALDGADAVAFCVGAVGKDRSGVQADGIAACLDAMAATGVDRLVAISASGGVVAGDDPLSRWLAKPILMRVLRDAYADMAAMEERIHASPVRWTVLRPPRLTNGRGRGRYRERRDGNVRWSYDIARADLAHAALDALADPTTIGRTISVAA